MKSKNKQPRFTFENKFDVWLLGIISAALIIGSVYFITLFIQPEPVQAGQLESSQPHSGEVLHKSLDLRLAAQAEYPSAPIIVEKDLGTQNGIKEKIVAFKVVDDNLTEHALVMEPSTPAPEAGYPVVIICHGYANPKDYETTKGYTIDMEFYAKHGFVAIKPDFRGQGLSSDAGQSDSAYYSMSYNTDTMSLISAIKQTKGMDKDNINIWGHSMGAYIALRASVLSKDIKNTILLSGPVGALTHMYVTYIPPSDENNPFALDTRQRLFAKYGTPAENDSFWKNTSPSNFLGHTAAHYQINVGAMDRVVPPDLSAELDSELTSLHRAHQYYIYADGDHGLINKRPLIWNRSLTVMNQKPAS